MAAGLVEPGWTPAETGAPDLRIHYHANVTSRSDVARVDDVDGSRPGGGGAGGTAQYYAATVVIDFVDARTQRLIWQG